MNPFGYTMLGFGGGKNQTFTAVAESIPLGSRSALFGGSYVGGVRADADPNTINKFIVAFYLTSWATGTQDIHCTVGTLGATAVTYGTPVSAGTTTNSWLDIAITPHTANKFVLVYTDKENNYYGTAVVGTISGDSISYGTAVVYRSASTQYHNMAMDFNTTDKFVVTYRNTNSTGYAIVGTVSGTSVSFGTAVLYSGTSVPGPHQPCIAYDRKTANKVLIAYQDGISAGDGTAIVGTVSGTDISFGTPVVFEDEGSLTTSRCITGDPFNAGKFLLQYRDSATGTSPRMVVGTVSGTSVSFGTPVAFESYAVIIYSLDADTNTENKFAMAGQGSAAASGYAHSGVIYVVSVDGTTPSIHSGEHRTTTYPNLDSALCFDYDPSNAGKFSMTYGDQHSDGLHLPAGNLGAGFAGQIASQTPDD